MRRRIYFLTVFGLLFLSSMCVAQEYLKADGNLPAKSFEFTTAGSADGEVYMGKISISPYCGAKGGSADAGTAPIPNGQLRITWYPETRTKLERLAGQSPAAGIDFPFQRVSAVRIQFDMGGPWEKTRTAITEEPQEDFPIPEGARKVVSVEIDYPILVRYDKDNKDWVKETHTLKWGEQETTSSCFWPQPSTTTGTAPGARKGERP